MWMCVVLCVACTTSNPLEEWGGFTQDGNMPGGGGMGGGDTTSDATGSLLDFDIAWGDLDEATFTDTAEQVPTNENDEEYEDFLENNTFGSQIKIAFADGKATVTGAVSGVEVTTSGAYVTVNSTVKGVDYVLSGTAPDGALKVYSEKKFKLTLADLSLTCKKGAPINIQSGKRCFVALQAGTTNTLADATDYTNTPQDEDQKACLFSEGQLIFCGTGTLTVTGNYKHGICSDDYVYIHSGVSLTVAAAVKDAIHTNEKIIMGGGKVLLTPSGDGMDCEEGNIDLRGGLLKANISGTASKAVKAATDIAISGGRQLLLTTGDAEYDSDDKDLSSSAGLKCDGNLTLNGHTLYIKSTGAAGKGINCDGDLRMDGGTVKIITTGRQYTYGSLDSSPKGMKADGNLTINGGVLWVKTSGGEGAEGIESKTVLTVNAGEVQASTYDDAMNAAKGLVIAGGNVYCYSSGNDAIDSNGTLTISGGTIVAVGTTSPEGGIDCDSNTFKLTGGTLMSVGGVTSNPTTNSSTQRSVVYGGSVSSGTLFTVTSSDDKQLLSYTVPRTYSQLTMLFSTAKLESGGKYTIYTGGSVSGGSTFGGLNTGGTYTKGTSLTTFTTSSMVTKVGNVTSTPGGR